MWNEISCTKLQLPPEPLTRGLPPPDPCSLCPLSSTEFVEPPPPPNKIPGYATAVCTRKVSLQRGFGWTLLSSLCCQTILDIAVIITDFVPPFDHVCGMTSGAKMLWKLLIVRMCGTQTECHFHIHDFSLSLLVSFTLTSKFTLNSSRSNYCIIIYLHIMFLVHCVSCPVNLRSVLLTLNITEFQDDGGWAGIKRENPL